MVNLSQTMNLIGKSIPWLREKKHFSWNYSPPQAFETWLKSRICQYHSSKASISPPIACQNFLLIIQHFWKCEEILQKIFTLLLTSLTIFHSFEKNEKSFFFLMKIMLPLYGPPLHNFIYTFFLIFSRGHGSHAKRVLEIFLYSACSISVGVETSLGK